MIALQYNAGAMLALILLISVGPPLVLAIIALVSFLKKKKKRALVFLSLAILYGIGLVLWLYLSE